MHIPFLNKKQRQQDSTAAVVGSGSAYISGREYPALENSDFWGALTDICQMYATMPVHVYGKDRTKIENHPLLYLLKVQTAPYLPADMFRFIMGFNLEIHGTAMAIIERDRMGTVTALYPVSPKAVLPSWENGRLYWKYVSSSEKFRDEDMLRVTRTPVGYTAVLSPIDYANRDLETFANAQELQSNYYRNGASIGGIVTVPRGTSKEVKNQIKALFQGEYSGSGNSYKTAIIEDSMKYEPIKLDNTDIAKLEAAQKWTREQILARFYGISSTATYSNEEQRGIQKMLAVQPRFVLFENAFDKLLPFGEYVKFNLEGMMRSDHSTTATYLRTLVDGGIMTTNESRKVLDLPPIEGGDVLRIPLNYGMLNPDGTIDNPNQTATDPFAFPTDKATDKVADKATRLTDKQYLEATQNVTRSARSKVESIMRRQVREYISYIKGRQENGFGKDVVQGEFETFVKQTEKDFGKDYSEVYKAVMGRLAPIVQKQIGKGELNADSLDAYAGKLGYSLAGRLGAMRVKEFSKADEEDYDDLYDDWITNKPAEESENETNRAGNAFQVFCYSELGLRYMRVVAAGDSCQFCQQLDGKVVEVNGNILAKGDIGEDGEGNVRHISHNYKHPPFHTYCHCGVAPDLS